MFEYIAELVVYNWLSLGAEYNLATALYFFVYSLSKIMVMVFVVVSVIAFVRSYLGADRLRSIVLKAKFGLGHLLAAMFGAISPFCSCSSIPLFLGFVKARIPAGVAFSFLITSPLVNEVAFVIMGEFFGWKIASLYALAGISLGIVGGLIIGAMGMEKEFKLNSDVSSAKKEVVFNSFNDRIKYALMDGFKTLEKLAAFLVVGVGIGAAIHGYVPQEFFVEMVGGLGVWSVPLAVVLGVPIYAGCSMIAPVIFSITANGVPLGTALAFMMSIAGLSAPEAVILKKVMSAKLLAIFFGVVAVGIVIVGYLFNLV